MLFSPIVIFSSTAAALGINCRGAYQCDQPYNAVEILMNQTEVIIAQTGGNGVFNTGDQIACTDQGGGIWNGAICAFYQSGASGTAQDAYNELQQLNAHGCDICGSIPTQPGNNVNQGQLTVNYVSKPCCEGTCICWESIDDDAQQ